MKQAAKGFTLLELLIVIGILAILAAVVVLVLNPAELLRQARDSQRISDLATIKSAIGLYLSSVTSPDLSGGTGFACVDETSSTFGASASGATSRFTGALTAAHAGVFTVGGEGWVAVNFGSITGGSPLASLPRDSVNNATYNYQYTCHAGTLTFELNADMESTRYTSGDDNVENSDGGNSDSYYEVGTDPGLNL